MNGGRYGIPFDVVTPDVFGERFGGGRIPAGTRGYTWSDWNVWVAPDEGEQAVRDYQWTEMRAGIFTVVFVGLVVGAIYLYDQWKDGHKESVHFKKSRYEEDD